LRVVDADGRRLGRVFEFRSPGRAESEPIAGEREVRSLLCGRRGLLERLGLRQPSPLRVPWSAVVAVDARELRVSGRRADYEEADNGEANDA
jgi:hypothetical protein